MGNCQAIDNATLVIQHPSGREDRLYWPVSASDIMKTNPGHYVALLLTTTTTTLPPSASAAAAGNTNSVRITRIKLLRPTDTLVLGQVYRLVTSQEVMKGLRAKKYAQMKKKESESADRQEIIKDKLGSDFEISSRRSDKEKTNHLVPNQERHRPRAAVSANSAATKSRAWQPSLQSISETTS
ncbi:hypothetical protein NMG60_11004399 [Bertholletia excelsa]